MVTESITRLEYLCRIIPPLLLKIKEVDFSHQLAPGKWSKKETLGHLIDSATNNHHRFVRAQFEDKPLAASHYQTMSSVHMISFWHLYNHHIAELIKQLPADILERECNSGDEVPHTLAWLFDDYVVHLEHHLGEMVEY
jgi:hypothetical protein